MRLRNAAVATASALALVLALPGSALATTGQFRYTYLNSDGYEMVGFMNNPESGKCLNLPGAGPDDLSPAFAPKNKTGSTAAVFLDADCDGDTFYVLNPGKGAGDRLLVRSVIFS